jgi:hypothetical protein
VNVEHTSYRHERQEVIDEPDPGSLPQDFRDARIAQLERELIEARSTIHAMLSVRAREAVSHRAHNPES